MKTKPGVIIFNAECESMCFKHPQGSRHSDNQKSKHAVVQICWQEPRGCLQLIELKNIIRSLTGFL